MSLYIGSVKYAPTRAIYRGFWAVNVHGFAGTEVDFNGTKKHIGSNESVTFKVASAGRYIVKATRYNQELTKVFVITDGDTDYIKDIGMYVGFKEVQYLETSGTQYIDTGFVPNQDTKVELDGSIDGYGIFFGVRTDALVGVSTIQATSTGYWAMGYNTSADTFGTRDANRHLWVKDKNKQYMDGVLKNNYTYANFTAMGTAYLFGYNNNGTPGRVVNGVVKVYSCKIYDNETLVRDLIPVVDDTLTPCLYDKVSQQMYYNAGTGSFVAGPDVYQELQYIQGTCNVQYINTGIAPTTDMNIYVKCGVASITAGASYSPFGSRETAGASDGVGIFIGSGSNTRVDSFYFLSSASDRWQVNSVASVDDVYETIFNGSTQTLIKNSTSLGSYTYTPVNTTTRPMYVNALNNAGTLQSGQWGSRIYRFTVEGYIDLIPVKRLIDNAVGMYDIINNKFYGNAGTGSFTAGPAKE